VVYLFVQIDLKGNGSFPQKLVKGTGHFTLLNMTRIEEMESWRTNEDPYQSSRRRVEIGSGPEFILEKLTRLLRRQEQSKGKKGGGKGLIVFPGKGHTACARAWKAVEG